MKLLLKALLCCLLALPLVAVAQDATTQVVDLGNGYSITVPADWVAKKLHDGAFRMGNSAITLLVTTPTRLRDLGVNFADNSNVVDVLVNLALPFDGATLESASVQKARYDNRQTAVYANSDDPTVDKIYVAVTMSDQHFGYLSLSGAKDDIAAFSSQIDDIIASFDSARTVSASSGVGCTVSIDAANAAQLRVGPGTNRGAISFLPAGVDVTVTGRIELNDGSVWYQLDKSEAAPNGTAAAELWVAADDVNASGDCDQVGDTSAPPIIPGSVAPPPAANSGGNSAADQGSASAAPGILPANGRWTGTLNATTNASCSGYQNVAIPTTDLIDQMVYVNSVSVINQNSFNYAGDVYTRAPGTNTFTGLFSFDGDVSSVQMWLTVNSPTSMSGQATGNFALDGTPCSFTVLFAIVHN